MHITKLSNLVMTYAISKSSSVRLGQTDVFIHYYFKSGPIVIYVHENTNRIYAQCIRKFPEPLYPTELNCVILLYIYKIIQTHDMYIKLMGVLMELFAEIYTNFFMK